MFSDKDEQEVDSWLLDTTEEDDDAAASSVDSNPRPPDSPWTSSFLSHLPDLQEQPEGNQTLEIDRDPILQRDDADEIRTPDLGDCDNPSSDSFSDIAGDPEENIDDIFHVWEINTDPELEKGTLADIFECSLKDIPSDDGTENFSGRQISVDAGGLKDLDSVESVIAAMIDLNISGSDEHRNS